LSWLFPQTRRKIIEGKANGDAVIDSLRRQIPGIVVFEPGRDSKEGRNTAVSHYIRAGNVHMPKTRVASMAPEIAFGVEAFIVETTSFQNAAHGSTEQWLVPRVELGRRSGPLIPGSLV
jgi:phage terminase large subunit-like protein